MRRVLQYRYETRVIAWDVGLVCVPAPMQATSVALPFLCIPQVKHDVPHIAFSLPLNWRAASGAVSASEGGGW